VQHSTKLAIGAVVILVALFAAWGLSQVAVRLGSIQASLVGDRDGSLSFENRKRTYLLHFPPNYDGRVAVPLVIVLHGGGGNGRSVAEMTGFSEEADSGGFVAVYPDGTGVLGDRVLTWNSGNCCGYAMDKNVNDVGFIGALIAKLEQEFNIDSSRVFATGISNGGMMAYRLGCELSDKIAGIGPVAGALNVDCNPSHTVSVVAFHGTGDQHVLYNGGVPVARFDPHPRVDRSVAYAISFWVQRDSCAPIPSETVNGGIIVDGYSNCSNGTAVALYTIVGGLHAWPGGQKGSVRGDEPTREISATQVMWEFFKQHPKQADLGSALTYVGQPGPLAAYEQLGCSRFLRNQ
jgi:polyhydroxybutyrate depolymerase